jgi:arylsulfatase A-like enzyme/Tfp pilus assembly protein PilF
MRGWTATLLILSVTAALGWLLWPGQSSFSLHRSADQNVLLVTIDTLRADALGCYGGRAPTPTLDGLAAGGARFTFAHAHAVMTLPSHASILTGMYPYQHGVRDNEGYRLPAGTPTLAALLDRDGYATGAFVGAFPLDSRFGLDVGYNLYNFGVEADDRETGLTLPERRADAVVAAALEWIDRQQGRWHAWIHLFDPHAPYSPPSSFAGASGERPYDREVAYVDRMLGPLIAALGSTPRRTVIVVTSDHGEGLGDHGEPTHGLFAYESTLRVPLIIAQVGPSTTLGAGGTRRSPTGREIGTPARHVDILPTVLDVLGATAPPGLPGRSLLPAIEGDASDRPSYFEAMSASLTRGWAPLAGVVAGRDKYIELPIAELYDLESDAGESQNLRAQQDGRARELQSLLKQFNASPAERPAAVDPHVASRLEALGYVTGSSPRKASYTEEDDPKRLLPIEQLLHEAVDLFQRSRLDDAAERYRRIVAMRPDTAVAYRHLNALGIAYARRDNQREARRTFEFILAGDATNGEALENLGTLALQDDRRAEARRWLERAVALRPHSAAARNGLGVLALREGRRGEAIEHWRAAVEADPSEFDALYNLATELVNDRRLEEARPFIQRFVSNAPPSRYARDIDKLAALLRSAPTAQDRPR